MTETAFRRPPFFQAVGDLLPCTELPLRSSSPIQFVKYSSCCGVNLPRSRLRTTDSCSTADQRPVIVAALERCREVACATEPVTPCLATSTSSWELPRCALY